MGAFAEINAANNSLITKWFDKHILILKDNYFTWGVKASGDYGKALRVEQKRNSHVLRGADYSEYTEEGRGKGKPPPSSVILKWIQDKGIKPKDDISEESLAFLIARKIKNEGIMSSKSRYGKNKNLFESVFNKESIAELQKELVLKDGFFIKNLLNERIEKAIKK